MLLLHYGRPSVCTVRMMSEMLTPLSDSRHTKAEGKFTPQICRSRIFVPANECTRVVPMYPSQSAMSHLHSLAQSMYIATFLPKHVIPTCFADYVTSTSGAIRLAFDLSPWPQVLFSRVFPGPSILQSEQARARAILQSQAVYLLGHLLVTLGS